MSYISLNFCIPGDREQTGDYPAPHRPDQASGRVVCNTFEHPAKLRTCQVKVSIIAHENYC